MLVLLVSDCLSRPSSQHGVRGYRWSRYSHEHIHCAWSIRDIRRCLLIYCGISGLIDIHSLCADFSNNESLCRFSDTIYDSTNFIDTANGMFSRVREMFSAQEIWMCSLTRSMDRSNSSCSCDGTPVTSVGPGGFCGPASLSVTAPVNCVTVFVSPPDSDTSAVEDTSLTVHSPISAYEQKPLTGCMCLDHWGTVESSDLKTGASNWIDDTGVHVLQPLDTCYPGLAEIYPYCRAQSFENNIIDCDCQAWPEDNSFEPYQENNPCLKAPYTTSVPATCTYL